MSSHTELLSMLRTSSAAAVAAAAVITVGDIGTTPGEARGKNVPLSENGEESENGERSE